MPTTYRLAHEVDDFDLTADLVIVLNAHPRFAPILEHDVRIEFRVAYNEDTDAVKHHGCPAPAKIKILKLEDRVGGSGDVRIIVDGEKYAARTDRQRHAILCHELYHINIDSLKKGNTDDHGRPVFRLIPDDWTINGFREVAGWYGDDSAELGSYRAVGELLSQSVMPFMASDEPVGLPEGTTLSMNGRPLETAGELEEAVGRMVDRRAAR